MSSESESKEHAMTSRPTATSPSAQINKLGKPGNESSRMLEKGSHRSESFVERSMVAIGVLEEAPPEQKSGKALFYPELPWGTPPGVQADKTRGSKFLLIWDMVTFVSCIYVAVSVPYIAGFLDRKLAGDTTCIFYTRGSPVRTTLAVGDSLVDFVFLADIVIQFHQASWEISTEGRPHWVLVDDLPEIRRKYLHGGFMTDFVAQIPWQYLDCIFPSAASALKILRLGRLIKLIRLYRVKKWLQGLYLKYPKFEVLIAGFELLLSMALMAHWLSCLWFSVGFEDGGWVHSEGILDDFGDLAEGAAYREWITAYYWAVTTMTTIGYGDISATTNTERTLAVFVMVIGCGFFAWATGRITQLITDQAGCYTTFMDKMDEVNQYLESRDITQSLQQSIKDFYMMKFPTMRVFNETEILNDLPQGLRRRLQLELFQDVVDRVPLFAACDKETKIAICERLVCTYRTMGITVTFEGTKADALYIVRFGQVDIMMNNKKVKECNSGELFGESALMGLDPSGRRRRTAVARTVCELGVLTKTDFEELLAHHRSFRNSISKLVGLHINHIEQDMADNKQVGLAEMFNIDWQTLHERVRHSHEVIQRAASCERIRKEEDRGLHYLRTHVQLHLQALHGEGTLDLNYPGAGFLALKWTSSLPDDAPEGSKIVRTMTPVFKWRRGDAGSGMIHIRHTLQAHLHTLNNDWTRMQKLEIGLFEVQDMRLAGTEPPDNIRLEGFWDAYNPTGETTEDKTSDAWTPAEMITEAKKKAFKDGHHFNGSRRGSFPGRRRSTGEGSDLMDPRMSSALLWEESASAKLLALGEMDLRTCISRRMMGSGGQVLRTSMFSVKAPDGAQKCMFLDFMTSASRLLHKDSRWKKVMDQMRSRTKAQFFATRRLRETQNMRLGLQNLITLTSNLFDDKKPKTAEDGQAPQAIQKQFDDMQRSMQAMQDQINQSMKMMKENQKLLLRLVGTTGSDSQIAPGDVSISFGPGKDQAHNTSGPRLSEDSPAKGRIAMVERYNTGSVTKFDI